MSIYIYIYIYSYYPQTKILESQRVLLKLNSDFEGWNSHVHRESPENRESANLSFENLSREIGRSLTQSYS